MTAPPYDPMADGGLQDQFVEKWRDNAYGCFSSGHKFCREVCPVMQVTRNEQHTPTAFHANIVAMEQGNLDVADVADDYVHCTQCGACELRCPNTLFTGDFYRHRTQTVKVECGRFTSNIKGIEADEFPTIPSIAGQEPTASLPPDVLREAIDQVAFAAAADDSRPVLAGVLVRLRDNRLFLAAADGFRLATRTVSLPEPVAQASEFIVPARALSELARIAERGLMDSVFFADSPSIFGDPARRPSEALEITGRMECWH